jgi:hypothetical protein
MHNFQRNQCRALSAEIDRAWADEVDRRWEELRSGQVQAIPFDEVLDKIRACLHSHGSLGTDGNRLH